MPSPFPGMDPWLESAHIWPDFHGSFACEIRSLLNQTLPAPYYARLETMPQIVAFDDETMEIIVPDEEGRHFSVEIRDARRGHRLVTFIEIASPTNKVHGRDRQSYIQKHMDVFDSDASLIEIDLLRAGLRSSERRNPPDQIAGRSRRADYLILVNRAWTRTVGTWQIYAVPLRETLPVIPVPLREAEADVPLDLQYVLNRAYDTGPYSRGAIDYDGPPYPPLPADDAAWASKLLASSEAAK